MKALITDVDNTLFDWVDIWYRSFSSMIQEVTRITGISTDVLYPSIQKIHAKHGTSEYAFLLGEIPELVELYGDKVIPNLEPAIAAYRGARTDSLHLYPRVTETLDKLNKNGIKLIAYTESMSFYSNYRFRKLGLDTIFDFMYSPPDHILPDSDLRTLRKYPEENYRLKKTVHNYTSIGEKKPN
jgi:phosphoglycolate phosphatase-like HAD superfamily hydrolase